MILYHCMPNRLRGKFFLSAEQTANGNSQTIPHGLKATPQLDKVIVTEESASNFDITEGTHTATAINVTVTSGVKYKVFGVI